MLVSAPPAGRGSYEARPYIARTCMGALIGAPDELLLAIAEHELLSVLALFCSGKQWAERAHHLRPRMLEAIMGTAGNAGSRQIFNLATVLWRLQDLEAFPLGSCNVDLRALRNAASEAIMDLQPFLQVLQEDDRNAPNNMNGSENHEQATLTPAASTRPDEDTARLTRVLCIVAARFSALAGYATPGIRVAAAEPYRPTMLWRNSSFGGAIVDELVDLEDTTGSDVDGFTPPLSLVTTSMMALLVSRHHVDVDDDVDDDDDDFADWPISECGPRSMPPSGMLAYSALVLASSRVDRIRRLKVSADSRPGWSVAYSLLGEAYTRMPSLSSITITAGVDDASATAFLNALPKIMPRLRRLTLEDSALYGAATVAALANRLAAGLAPLLTLLNLSGSSDRRHLCDTGAAALGQCLASGQLPNLQRLILQNSHLTSAGVIAIVDGLEASPAAVPLNNLIVMDSQVGDEGMVRLASAIGAHHIRVQECRRTQVGRAGAQALLDAGINVDVNRLPFGQELRQT